MNSLREITQVITRLKLEKIEIIDNEPKNSEGDNISKLYFGIKSGQLTTDHEGAQHIYGKPIVDTRFTTLKNRLKTRLLNTLFFLDIKTPAQSELAEIMYKTYRYLFWSKTLLLIGARQSSIKLGQKCLLYANRAGLTSEAVQILTDLRNLAGESGETTLYNEYNQQLRHHYHNLAGELEAREYNDRLRMLSAKTMAEQPEHVTISEEFVRKLDSIQPQPDSFFYKLFYLRVKNFSKQIKKDYRGAIEVCEEAEVLLRESTIFANKLRIGEFVLTKLYCYLMLKDFIKGEFEAKRCSELFATTSNAWFTFMDYYFLLAMHTGHFGDANRIYNDVLSNPRFAFQLEQTKEQWRLYEAYLLFALRITDTGFVDEKKFDMKRFLRDVPNYKKDKRGYNIAILVLQIIILLEQNDFDSIIDRMDALRTYRQRYLSSGGNNQSALFFKMLMIMEKSFFTYEDTKVKSQKYYDQMIELESSSGETQEGMRILPFDWLWNRILEMLKQKEEAGIIR
jgi:hypothetical protein